MDGTITERPLPAFAARLVSLGFMDEAAALRAAAATGHDDDALSRYVVAEGLVTRADLYEAKRRVTVQSHLALPEWDVLLNAPGQVFDRFPAAQSTLALGLSSDLAKDVRGVFLLTTQDLRQGRAHMALVKALGDGGYRIRATLVATNANLLSVIREEWRSPTATQATDSGEESHAYAQWDDIIEKAVRLGASDIHLDASESNTRIQFRILGELQDQPYPLSHQQGIGLASSMYNTMVQKATTSEGFDRRRPQRAGVTRDLPTGRVRLRYSHIPIEIDGVSVTLRLIHLGGKAARRTGAELGYAASHCAQLERMFARSSGLILFLGTTGSGKSTSLACYAQKKVRDNLGKLLRTIEDPVENIIEGATQTAVARSASDTDRRNPFAQYMEEVVRSDPDYLMVGEISDRITAQLALQEVRSGHLCMSSLHADGAPLAYDRLIDLGVARGDLAKVGIVAGLIYQRLVPQLCPHCKVPLEKYEADHPGDPVLGRLRAYLDRAHPLTSRAGDAGAKIAFRHGPGCKRCDWRGIIDRTACAEILVPTVAMVDAIRDGKSRDLWQLWRAGINENDPSDMTGRTAFEHALWKMMEGIVSPHDVEAEFRWLDDEVFA